MALYSEIALVPAVFDQDHYESEHSHRPMMELLRIAFSDLRFVRCPHDKWLENARECCGDSIAANKLLEFLLKRKRLLSHGQFEGVDWVDYAERSHQRHHLKGLLVDELTDCTNALTVPVVRVGQLLEEAPEWWESVSTSRNVNCTGDMIVDCLRLLLRHGREIHIVDRYIDPTQQRYKSVLSQMLIEIMHNANKPVVFIHSSDKAFENFGIQWTEKARTAFADLGSTALKMNVRVTVCLWDSGRIIGGSHDRHLLTDIGGCNVGFGFSEARGQTTTVSVLSEDSRLDLLRRYTPSPNTAVGLIDSFKVGRKN
jgi:hypothetical protein